MRSSATSEIVRPATAARWSLEKRSAVAAGGTLALEIFKVEDEDRVCEVPGGGEAAGDVQHPGVHPQRHVVVPRDADAKFGDNRARPDIPEIRDADGRVIED